MKKLSAFLQKYNGYISIVVFGLMFVFALGMATPAAPCKSYQETFDFYSQIMPYNNTILLLSIFGLLLSAFYFILRNHVRSVYYVSNFAWYGINFAYILTSGIVTISSVAIYQEKYMALPFAEMNEYFSTRSDSVIRSDTPVFLLGYLLGVLILLLLVPYVLVLIDKIQLRIRYEQNKKLGVENVVTYDPKEVK